MAIRNHSKRPAALVERMDKQVRQRIGIDRHHPELTICGVQVKRLIKSPETIRERWIRKPAWFDGVKGRSYHFAVLRFTFESPNGGIYTALQAQTHDAHHGYALSVTGFWGLQPALLPK